MNKMNTPDSIFNLLVFPSNSPCFIDMSKAVAVKGAGRCETQHGKDVYVSLHTFLFLPKMTSSAMLLQNPYVSKEPSLENPGP